MLTETAMCVLVEIMVIVKEKQSREFNNRLNFLCDKALRRSEVAGKTQDSVFYHSFGPILLSNTRTDPSPRPAAMRERWESQERLVTQLSAPVGMSW